MIFGLKVASHQGRGSGILIIMVLNPCKAHKIGAHRRNVSPAWVYHNYKQGNKGSINTEKRGSQ